MPPYVVSACGNLRESTELHLKCTFSNKMYYAMRGSYLLGNSTDWCLVSTSSGWGVAFGMKKTWIHSVLLIIEYPWAKENPLQSGIDWYFCKSRRTESPVDEGENAANDGDPQTLAIPTTSNSTARADEGNKTAETGSYKSPEQKWQIFWASDQFKSHAIETHRKSGRHKSALEAEMIATMSIFRTVRGGKRNWNISLKESLLGSIFF